MTKKDNSSLLSDYISEINTEINKRTLITLNNLNEDIPESILYLDENICPLLLVISSDISKGNRNDALNNAILLKLSLLAIDSADSTIVSDLTSNLNLNNIFTMISGLSPLLSSIPSSIGSLLECIGKNVTNCHQSNITRYGYAMHSGSHISDPAISNLLYDIGIQIGILKENSPKSKTNYDSLNLMVKKLPNNKYKKRLSELIKQIYEEPEPKETKLLKQIPVLLPSFSCENCCTAGCGSSTSKKPILIKKENVKFNDNIE